MPVYTYRCEACGVQFERHQSFTDTPLKTCPECRKKALKKVITPTKIIFKGSGFYATDHKSPSGESSSTKKARMPRMNTPRAGSLAKECTKKTSKKEKDSAPKESAPAESKSPSGGDSE